MSKYIIARVPFRTRSILSVILIDVVEGVGVIFSANDYLLIQLFFISVNWYIIAFINDINASIRAIDVNSNNTTLSFVQIVKFHTRVLRNLHRISDLMNAPIFVSNIFNQMIMFSTMYQIHLVRGLYCPTDLVLIQSAFILLGNEILELR